MRIPKFDGRTLAVAAFTLAPLAIAVGAGVTLRFYFGQATRGLYWTEVFLLYMGLLQSLIIGLYFRQPLIDPHSRWGILGRRERPRPRLWLILVYIALCAPIFSLMAQEKRVHTRDRAAFKATIRAFQAEQIAFHTETERNELAAANEQERLAAQCRDKAARGEPSNGTRTWTDQAKFHADLAAWWRTAASRSSRMKKQMEQLGRQP